jgi:Dienelactone hydrolase family
MATRPIMLGVAETHALWAAIHSKPVGQEYTAMIEKTLDITTEDGEMETFICHPERNGPSPTVFLLMDAHGLREELKDMARRLGTVGYYVLLPNLYYRAGRDTIYGLSVHEEGSAEHKRMRAVRTKMTIPPVMDDVAAMLSFTDRQNEVKKGAIGCPGYCIERPLRVSRRGTLSRAHRRRGLVLRDLAHQRGRGEPTSLIGQGTGGALHRLRRARQSGTSGDGRGAPYPVWAGRHRW